MSREIKFRVWDKVDKEMMLPAEWEEDYVGNGDKKIGLYIYRSAKDPRQHSSLDWILRHPEHFEIDQFAGLKDKGGTELDWWEGDLFETINSTYKIIYDLGCFWFVSVVNNHRFLCKDTLDWVELPSKIEAALGSK